MGDLFLLMFAGDVYSRLSVVDMPSCLTQICYSSAMHDAICNYGSMLLLLSKSFEMVNVMLQGFKA